MNVYQFIKNHLAFFEAAACHPAQFMKWVKIVGGKEAVDLVNKVNLEFAGLFQNNSIVFSNFFEIHSNSIDDIDFKLKLTEYFPSQIETVLDVNLPKLEPLALKFKQNTGFSHNQNLNYHAMTVRMAENDLLTSSKIIQDIDKQDRLDALKELKRDYLRLLKSFVKVRKTFHHYGKNFEDKLLKHLYARFNILKNCELESTINRLLSIYQLEDAKIALANYKKIIFDSQKHIQDADNIDKQQTPDNPLLDAISFQQQKDRAENGYVVRYIPSLLFRNKPLDVIKAIDAFIKDYDNHPANATSRLFTPKTHNLGRTGSANLTPSTLEIGNKGLRRGL